MTAQFLNQLPVTNGKSPEGAFRHAVHFHERVDVGEYRMMFHDRTSTRVITRMSTQISGDYTILRGIARRSISSGMSMAGIDIEKLKADMAARVAETSARKFSLAATSGKNQDFYRNFINNGQNKRLSADVFAGIVRALGEDPARYINGSKPALSLPSAAVLTSTFSMLLESLGVDPDKAELAQKLARQFPGALQRVSDLREGLVSIDDSSPSADSLDLAAGQSEA